MGLWHEPRCSLCRIGQNFCPVYWRPLWGINNNFIQCTHLRYASGVNSYIVTWLRLQPSRYWYAYTYMYILKIVSNDSLVRVPLQIVNRNYFYTIVYMYLPKGVHIWHNNWLLCVNYNKGLRSDFRCDLRVEVQSQIYMYLYLSVLWLLTRTSLSCFDYRDVHIWHNGCLWCVDYNTLKITDMTLESKVKVKYIKILSKLHIHKSTKPNQRGDYRNAFVYSSVYT